MTAFCAHPGCLAALCATNTCGVCRDHIHGPACRCSACRRPRRVNRDRKTVRTVQKWRVKSRAELVAEGLLPGLSLPQPKGQS